MNKKIRHLSLIFVLLNLAKISTFPQDSQDSPTTSNQTAEWMRIQGENGEFSIEVPARYGLFYDPYGFLVSNGWNTFQLAEMNLFNAYTEKTLISIESYKAPKGGLDVIFERDNQSGKKDSFKLNEAKVRRIINESDEFYSARWYFELGDYIYILTAASRNGETSAMKRFFESIEVKGLKSKTAQNLSSAVPFSKLKATLIEIYDVQPANIVKDPKPKAENTGKDENILPLLIVTRPTPYYTDSARYKGEEGTIEVRATFSNEGRITKIGIAKTLREGLLRQSVFAAIRMKFLPQEKDGKEVTVIRPIQYRFRIY